jgi:transposase
MDKEGNILRHHRFPTRTESITAFLANISNADMEIALEACGLWRGIYTILHTQGYTTHLANPWKIHDIAGKKKTDKEDAKILADLLRTGYLPTVHIPPEHILKLRGITRHKATLTRLRATIQIKIKSYLRREGTPYHHNIWKEDTLDQIAQQDRNLTNLINLYKQFKKEENEVMRSLASRFPLAWVVIWEEISFICSSRFSRRERYLWMLGMERVWSQCVPCWVKMFL